MNAVSFINDGNYNVEIQDGSDQWREPFSERGDNTTFECIREYVCREAIYKPRALMSRISTRRGSAYLVEESDTEKETTGLVRYRRTFASIPLPRNEYSSYTKTYQFARVSSGSEESGTAEIAETTFPGVNARTYFEYGLKPFSPIIAPRVALIFGQLQYFGPWGQYSVGDEIAAQDSDCGRYKAGIYYRETIYIRAIA